MKTILIIFFIASSCAADIGVVVRSTNVIVGKEVYAGDTSRLSDSLTERSKVDQSLTFSIFDFSLSGKQSQFDAIGIVDLKAIDKDQAKIDMNSKSKTDAERIDAIIKYLDLDK